MMRSIALLKKEFLEQWRTHKILIIGLGFLLSGLQGPLLAKYLPNLIKNASSSLSGAQFIIPKQSAVDAILNYLAQMSFLPALIMVLVAMGTLAGERERGTLVFLLTKPVTRSQVILSKFLTYFAVMTAALVLTGLAAAYYTLLLFDTSFEVGPLLALNLALISYMSFALALIILFSALFKSAVAAGGAGFLAVMLLSNLVKLIPNWTAYFPQVVFDTGVARDIMTLKTPAGSLALPVLVGLLLTAAVLALACYIYERSEM